MSTLKLAAYLVAAMSVACAGERAQVPALTSAQQARTSPAAALSRRLAPQALDEANAMLGQAERSRAEGDDVGAALLADRAVALYQRALMLSRTARATVDLAEAEAVLSKADAERLIIDSQRAEANATGEALERRLFLLREAIQPKKSGPADPIREAARLSAARSLAQTARLLCGAAALVFPATAGLDAELTKLDELDKKLTDGPKIAPIDDAARERAACLTLLTAARRTHTAAAPAADPLLAELSAAGVAPVRDERGIVVTLRDAFTDKALATDARSGLAALGRVAAAHDGVALQVVVHDAIPRPGAAARGALARAAVIAAGAKAELVRVELAGTRAPIVDTGDVKNRGRNARLEVVFVTSD